MSTTEMKNIDPTQLVQLVHLVAEKILDALQNEQELRMVFRSYEVLVKATALMLHILTTEYTEEQVAALQANPKITLFYTLPHEDFQRAMPIADVFAGANALLKTLGNA